MKIVVEKSYTVEAYQFKIETNTLGYIIKQTVEDHAWNKIGFLHFALANKKIGLII